MGCVTASILPAAKDKDWLPELTEIAYAKLQCALAEP